jgi:hypothetical protein
MKNIMGLVAAVVIAFVLASLAMLVIDQNAAAEKATAECTIKLAGKYHADYVAHVCANAVVNK